jgi:hypothetical protein
MKTINLDNSLHRELKIESARLDLSMHWLIHHILENAKKEIKSIGSREDFFKKYTPHS